MEITYGGSFTSREERKGHYLIMCSNVSIPIARLGLREASFLLLVTTSPHSCVEQSKQGPHFSVETHSLNSSRWVELHTLVPPIPFQDFFQLVAGKNSIFTNWETKLGLSGPQLVIVP